MHLEMIKNKKQNKKTQLPSLSHVGKVFQDVDSLASRLHSGACFQQDGCAGSPAGSEAEPALLSCYFETHQPHIPETKGAHTEILLST